VAGAINHDRVKHRPEVDVTWDLNVLPWPWPDCSFDLIVACAVLEHLRLNLVESIDECWRILRPGGMLHVKLPHWQSDNSYSDPTHYWKVGLEVLNVFDPDTRFGRQYGFYTERKWRIIEGPKLNKARTSFAAKLRVRKDLSPGPSPERGGEEAP
jgi:predicted SAM-dependent methyltransferase